MRKKGHKSRGEFSLGPETSHFESLWSLYAGVFLSLELRLVLNDSSFLEFGKPNQIYIPTYLNIICSQRLGDLVRLLVNRPPAPRNAWWKFRLKIGATHTYIWIRRQSCDRNLYKVCKHLSSDECFHKEACFI